MSERLPEITQRQKTFEFLAETEQTKKEDSVVFFCLSAHL